MKKYPGIKKYIVILLAVLFLIPSFNLQSQSLKAYEKAGDDAFQKKEY